MVHPLQCSSAHIPLRPLFFSILLLISSMEVACSDAGRLQPLRLPEIDPSKQEQAAAVIRERMIMEGRRRALIGSRPPRCERVCMSCGHCEAVQVPVVPQDHHYRLQKRDAATIGAAMFSYRVDDITNYKPLSWKCRCGGTILDP